MRGPTKKQTCHVAVDWCLQSFIVQLTDMIQHLMFIPIIKIVIWKEINVNHTSSLYIYKKMICASAVYINLARIKVIFFVFGTWWRGRLIWRRRFFMAVWSSEKSKGALLQSDAWSALSTSSGPDRLFSHSHSSLGGKIRHTVKTHIHTEKQYWHIRPCWSSHYRLCHSVLRLHDDRVSRRKWAVKEPHQLLICRVKP